MTKQIKAPRIYAHGEEHETARGNVYCASCDVFIEPVHLRGAVNDLADVRRHREVAARAAKQPQVDE